MIRKITSALTRWEWIILLAITSILVLDRPIFSLALLALPLLWISRKITRGVYIDPTPLNSPMLLFMVMALVSLYATFDIPYSYPVFKRLVIGSGVYFAVVSLCSARRRWVLGFSVFLLAGVGLAVVSLFGTSWIPKWSFLDPLISIFPARLNVLFGSEGLFHPNIVAGSLLWFLPSVLTLTIFAFRGSKNLATGFGLNPKKRKIALILLVISFLILHWVFLLTQSRGAWVAYGAVGLLIFSTILPSRRLKIIVGILSAITIGIMAWFTLTGLLQDSPQISTIDIGATPALSLSTLNGRIELWSRALYGLQDFPFTGMGVNTFRQVVHILYPLFTISPDYDIQHTHNTYLQVALDLGLPGLIAFLSLQIGAIVMLVKAWRTRNLLPFDDSFSRAVILALGGGLVAGMLHGFVDSVIMSSKPGVLWWYLLGLIAALYRLQVSGNREQGKQISGIR